jgi:signal peptidase
MARRATRVVSALIVAAGLLFGALLIVPSLLGLQRYVIVSGSMTGTYDRGSLVLDEVVPVSSLKVGDVITYRPPAGTHLVTHRIASVTHDRSGAPVFRTKGDANATPDPWKFTLPKGEQARVRFGIPYVGFALAALSRRELRMLIIGVPAGLIAFFSLAGLWREAGAQTATVPR